MHAMLMRLNERSDIRWPCARSPWNTFRSMANAWRSCRMRANACCARASERPLRRTAKSYCHVAALCAPEHELCGDTHALNIGDDTCCPADTLSAHRHHAINDRANSGHTLHRCGDVCSVGATLLWRPSARAGACTARAPSTQVGARSLRGHARAAHLNRWMWWHGSMHHAHGTRHMQYVRQHGFCWSRQILLAGIRPARAGKSWRMLHAQLCKLCPNNKMCAATLRWALMHPGISQSTWDDHTRGGTHHVRCDASL